MFDEDLYNAIKPIYLSHIITCAQKYVITNHTVKQIGFKHIVINVFAVIALVVLLEETLRTLRGLVNLTFFIIYVLSYILYIVKFTIMCSSNFFYRSVNFELFSCMCYLNSNLYDEKQTKSLRKISWGLCVTLILIYCWQIVIKTLGDAFWFTLRGIFVVTTISFEIEVLYMIFISYFLICKLDKWIEVVKLRSGVQEVDSDKVKEECNRLSLLFQTHLDCIALMKKTSQLTVLIHFVSTFFQTMAYFMILLIWAKDNSGIAINFAGVQTWVIRLLLTQTVLCVTCEMLYLRVRLARTTALRMLTSDITPTWRKFAKNLVRSSKINKISACGLFSVDAALPLRMGSVVLTHIIVLLQFMYL